MSQTILRSLKYFERVGAAGEWTLENFELNSINLVVGRNSTGKTRTMNVIWNLAKLFVVEPRYRTGNAGYDVLFETGGVPLRYLLSIVEGEVTQEEVAVDGKILLERHKGKDGAIFTQTLNEKVAFRPPANELAAVTRRDSLQHAFLEPLHQWAQAVRHYAFGAALGKNHVALLVKEGPELDDRDSEAVVAIFRKGTKDFPDFAARVRDDMCEMGYCLEEVLTCAPQTIKIMTPNGPNDVVVLGVRERGVDAVVEQGSMSQGMFRALSILIQVNYSQMAKRANCILIDDIGEGLDYERSTKLIEILQRKALESEFQLVMTTNDRFVMNAVPLKYWSVLQRDGGHVRVRNYQNSRAIFEDFQETGLSNFSFLEMDFVNGVSNEESMAHE